MPPYQDDGTGVVDWTVDPAAAETPSRQLVERCLDALCAGALAPGDRLPSVRGLAAEALVSHNTVARAYRDLEQLGAARGEGGRGVFVTDAGPAIAAAARRSSTLANLGRAASAALRAGHPRETLRRVVDAAELGPTAREECA